jgi:hypothetical protein
MNDELKILKGVVVVYFKDTTPLLPTAKDKTHEKSQ